MRDGLAQDTKDRATSTSIKQALPISVTTPLLFI